MKTDSAQQSFPTSEANLWPALLFVTAMNGGLWFASSFDLTGAGAFVAASAALSGAIGMFVQKARTRSQKRQAVWDAYADREISRSTAG